MSVHKRSSRSQLKNYRPVSLLSVISKVMETIINMQFANNLEGNSLLAANQFGFRRNLGTADALTALHNSWASSIGRGGAARVLAVGIAGAFDKVSHAGVLFKLQQCGIQGILLAWLTSYLSNRSIHDVYLYSLRHSCTACTHTHRLVECASFSCCSFS